MVPCAASTDLLRNEKLIDAILAGDDFPAFRWAAAATCVSWASGREGQQATKSDGNNVAIHRLVTPGQDLSYEMTRTNDRLIICTGHLVKQNRLQRGAVLCDLGNVNPYEFARCIGESTAPPDDDPPGHPDRGHQTGGSAS